MCIRDSASSVGHTALKAWPTSSYFTFTHTGTQTIWTNNRDSEKSQQADNENFMKGYLLWQLLLLQLWRVQHKSQRTKAKTEIHFSNYFIYARNTVEMKNSTIHFCCFSLCQNFFLRINADDNELELAVLQLLIDWPMNFSWMGKKGFTVSNHSCYAIILIMAGCMSISPSHA